MTTKVQSQMLTSPFRRNALINGEFNVWQRGTSFAAIASGAYSADRWLYQKVGAAVHTVSRSTDVPTAAQAGRLFNYSLYLDCTTIDASIAAGDVCVFTQRVEGYNWLPLAQRACYLTFWVKGTKTGIHCVSLNNSGSNRAYVAEYTISVADTWEFKSIALPASPSAGTWDYTTGNGLEVSWALSAGTDWQTTGGSWQTVATRMFATANQVNATDNAANDFRIAGAQLEAGTAYSEFEQRYFQDELKLSERYFQRFVLLQNNCFGFGSATGANAWEVGRSLRSQMRTIPAITVSGSVGDYQANFVACTGSIILSLGNSSTDSYVVLSGTTGSGIAAADGVGLRNGNAAEHDIDFSAEL